MIVVRFWGVRGSIPTPGEHTVEFGGNTSCIEIEYGRAAEARHRIIIDAGTGIRALGEKILQEQREGREIAVSLFLTHTHWDHIMGFPFFGPIYERGVKIDLYGPITWEEESLRNVMSDQLSYRFFPVRLGELAADIRYRELREETIELPDGMIVRTHYLNHPVLCLGYCFEFEGRKIGTAYDTEPFRNLFPTDPGHPDYDEAAAVEGDRAAREENERLAAFYSGADLLVHDSQYTREEYLSGHVGWGHSSYRDALETAERAAVSRLVLFHHDPDRSDAELRAMLVDFERWGTDRGFSVDFAREGLVYSYPGAEGTR